jgi:hypothetical protein
MQFLIREYDEDFNRCEFVVDKITDIPHKRGHKYIVRESKQTADGLQEYSDIIDCYTYSANQF